MSMMPAVDLWVVIEHGVPRHRDLNVHHPWELLLERQRQPELAVALVPDQRSLVVPQIAVGIEADEPVPAQVRVRLEESRKRTREPRV